MLYISNMSALSQSCLKHLSSWDYTKMKHILMNNLLGWRPSVSCVPFITVTQGFDIWKMIATSKPSIKASCFQEAPWLAIYVFLWKWKNIQIKWILRWSSSYFWSSHPSVLVKSYFLRNMWYSSGSLCGWVESS